MLAERHGADFDRIHEAVTRDYPRMQGFARAGFAGGPCLLKDTMQLASFNHNLLTLGQHAMMINEGLPRFLVDQLRASRNLQAETVGILGMAFKGDSDDPRESLSYKLRKVLEAEAGEVTGRRLIRRRIPVDDYLRMQGRFAHLFKGDGDARSLAKIQAIADRNIRRFGLVAQGALA